MNTKHYLAILVAIIIFIAVFTNPKEKADYVEWVSAKEKKENIAVFFLPTKSIYSTYTDKNNYLLFTIFKTEIDGVKGPVTVGAFDRYFTLEQSKEKE